MTKKFGLIVEELANKFYTMNKHKGEPIFLTYDRDTFGVKLGSIAGYETKLQIKKNPPIDFKRLLNVIAILSSKFGEICIKIEREKSFTFAMVSPCFSTKTNYEAKFVVNNVGKLIDAEIMISSVYKPITLDVNLVCDIAEMFKGAEGRDMLRDSLKEIGALKNNRIVVYSLYARVYNIRGSPRYAFSVIVRSGKGEAEEVSL